MVTIEALSFAHLIVLVTIIFCFAAFDTSINMTENYPFVNKVLDFNEFQLEFQFVTNGKFTFEQQTVFCLKQCGFTQREVVSALPNSPNFWWLLMSSSCLKKHCSQYVVLSYQLMTTRLLLRNSTLFDQYNMLR